MNIIYIKNTPCNNTVFVFCSLYVIRYTILEGEVEQYYNRKYVRLFGVDISTKLQLLYFEVIFLVKMVNSTFDKILLNCA